MREYYEELKKYGKVKLKESLTKILLSKLEE